jgi:hypothetical protein
MPQALECASDTELLKSPSSSPIPVRAEPPGRAARPCRRSVYEVRRWRSVPLASPARRQLERSKCAVPGRLRTRLAPPEREFFVPTCGPDGASFSLRRSAARLLPLMQPLPGLSSSLPGQPVDRQKGILAGAEDAMLVPGPAGTGHNNPFPPAPIGSPEQGPSEQTWRPGRLGSGNL